MTPGECIAFSAGSLFTLALLFGGPALFRVLDRRRHRREMQRDVVDLQAYARSRRGK